VAERPLVHIIFSFGLILGGFFIGLNFRDSKSHEPMPTPSEMRSELTARCVNKPDVLAEIQDSLPDNDSGKITPAMVRKVLRDVVSHC
jgi:hypothetical protein